MKDLKIKTKLSFNLNLLKGHTPNFTDIQKDYLINVSISFYPLICKASSAV